ncbi:MAG: KH domain-containing protein [Candidatus ainarchaeum sp.]|nr:KH domain-containing protein [Candidatus ainarchaeum sp.]
MSVEIIVPGEKISDSTLSLSSTYIKDGKTYALAVGMMDENKFTPLEWIYTPKLDDTLVGIVSDKNPKGYSIDINLPDRGMINARDIRDRLRIGDVVFGIVSSFSSYGDIVFYTPKKLQKGKVFKIPSSKIPRIIGKKSSMISMIREATGTQIVVGNNGYIWVDLAGNVSLVGKVFEEIVENAHKKGLTDHIAKFIEENKKK